ncbi:MAG: histidine ammonia-lyase [Kiloniellales bacterium]|nr:histidine ammonia-lyase [Kiloniellales bacterium]
MADNGSEGNGIRIVPGRLSLAELRRAWRAPGAVSLDPAAWPAVERAAELVAEIVREGRTVYGVNTGFGKLARTSIDADQVTELQRRLVLSHAAGVGAPLSDRVVRLVLLLKVNALARGHSGARRETLEALLALLNGAAYPVIPGQGSVGASGDLAPLAHLSAALIGEGEMRLGGETRPARDALSKLGLAPLTLAAKEGLALLNGTQVSAALALDALFRGLDALEAALITGALSVDAALGSDVPFDPRISALRGQPGQIAVAAAMRGLLADSEIRASHLDCDRVQDPYSLRCQPQVMGAVADTLAAAAAMVGREANAVSDNPLVFPDAGELLSGGNFHAEPVGLAADMMAIALAEIGALAERRIALLTDAALSSLPPFLTEEPGLNSGFMIAHVTAAALASENKSLAHPASVDSLPTSANQEDHVSMATFAARRLADILENLEGILAIELLAGAQGVDLRRPLKTGPRLQAVVDRLRETVPFLADDRAFAPDIAAARGLIAEGSLGKIARLDGEFDAHFSI